MVNPTNAFDLSVILCINDHFATIHETLNALNQQQLNRCRIEFVIVDYGCSDATWAVVEAFPYAHPTKHCRIGETSVQRARNVGVDHSQGNIVFFAGLEEIVTPTLFRDHITIHRKRSEQKLCVAGRLVFTEPAATELFTQYIQQYDVLRQTTHLLPDDYVEPRNIRLSNLSIPRNAFNAVGQFDETIDDVDGLELAFRLDDAGWRFLHRPDLTITNASPPNPTAVLAKIRQTAAGQARDVRYHSHTPVTTASTPVSTNTAQAPADAASKLSPM